VCVCVYVCVSESKREALYFDPYHVLALEHAVLAILASCRKTVFAKQTLIG